MSNYAIDVVIPVYGNREVALRCVDSVLAARQHHPCGLILVDDASPDEETRGALAARIEGLDHCRLIAHDTNLGFAASVNTGISASNRDVVILNSDVVVPLHWIDRLRSCVASASRVATVTPFTNSGSVCSYPYFCESSELPEGLDLEAVAGLFAEANAGQYLELPTGVGFCMYISRECLDEVGLFDVEIFGEGYGEENDFCLRASAEGFTHLLCGDLFVYHAGGVSFGDSRADLMERADSLIVKRHPHYGELVERFIDADTPGPLRKAVDVLREARAEQLPVLLAEARYREEHHANRSREHRALAQKQEVELRRFTSKCAELESLLQDARSAFTKADSEVGQRENAYGALEQQLEQSREAARNLEAEFRALELRTRELHEQRDSLDEEARSLRFQRDEALEQRDERGKQLEATEAALRHSQKELLALADTQAALHKTLGETIESAEAEQTALNAQLDRLREELAELNSLTVVRAHKRIAGVFRRA